MNGIAVEKDQQKWHDSIYGQLHRLARRALQHEKPGHSLQPTLLVNDAYLRLLEQRNICMGDHSAVMAAGSTIIRRLLVDYARKRKSQKRGGSAGRGVQLRPSSTAVARSFDVLEINDSLERLSALNQRAAQVVDLKFFGGLTCQEISEQLEVSVRTVKNDWRFAKAWLYRQLGPEQSEGGSE